MVKDYFNGKAYISFALYTVAICHGNHVYATTTKAAYMSISMLTLASYTVLM